MSLAQLQQQAQNFQTAYQQGKISLSQYNQAMLWNKVQQQNLTIPKTTTTQTTVAKQPTISSPMPAQPGSSEYVVQGSYVQEGSTIVNSEGKELGVVGAESQPTLEAGKTYGVIPPPTQPLPTVPSPANTPNMDSPLQQGVFGHNADIFKTTGTAGVTPVVNTKERATIALEVTAIAAAPVVGPAIGAGSRAGIIGAEAFGAVFNAGASYVQTGKVTPQTIIEGATIGGAFGVAGGKIASVAGKAIGGGVGSVVSGGANLATKTLPVTERIAGFGVKTGLNAGLGAGANAGIEYAKTGRVTPENVAIGAGFGAGFTLAGEAAGLVGSKIVKPRITDSLSQSYEKTFSTGEMWKPTLKQQALMKLTGSKPNSPATQAKATEMLSESYKTQFKLNEAILTDKPMPQNIAGRTGLEAWTPTAKEAEMMTFTGAKPKTPAPSINTARTIASESYSLGGLKRQIIADDMFDFSIAPKTSMRLENVPVTQSTAKGVLASNKLPVYFGLGTVKTGTFARFDEYHKEQPIQETPLEKGIPENQLGYDYRGPLSFKKPTAFEQIQQLGETKQTSGGKMKPLWESQGNKYPTPQENFRSSSPISQVTSLQPKTRTTSEAYAKNEFAASTAKTTTQTRNQFVTYVKAPPYYQNQRVREETETTFISVPNSGLKHPQQPAFTTAQTPKQKQAFTQSQPSLFNQPSQLTKNPLDTRQTSNQPILIDTTQANPPISRQDNLPIASTRPTPITTPISPTEQTPKTTPLMPNPFIQHAKAPAAFNPMLGAKGMEFGGNRGDNPFFGGIASRKRLYPILSAEEFWG